MKINLTSHEVAYLIELCLLRSATGPISNQLFELLQKLKISYLSRNEIEEVPQNRSQGTLKAHRARNGKLMTVDK